MGDKPPYVAQISPQMSMSEKCNTLRRLLHFNFCGICDQSVMSLTPSGDPRPYLPQTPQKTHEDGRGRGARWCCRGREEGGREGGRGWGPGWRGGALGGGHV